MKTAYPLLCLFLLGGIGILPLLGQDSACANEKSRQFDFWIGEWDVYSENSLVGTNTIVSILDGCVLQENWEGSRGSKGSSLNFYNPTSHKWQQFWVWKNGTTLELSGDYADRRMVLMGESRDREGKSILNRITWYNNPDGTVRQHWETSDREGENWTTVFDGLYKKKN